MRSILVVLFFSLILPASAFSIPLKITSYVRETGIIDGATITSTGYLEFSGISHGEIIVKRGGNLLSTGVAKGGISNNGGTVKITGITPVVFANSGTTTIHGIVDIVKGNGKVIYKSGAVVGGKKIK
ncbi:MAG: hypothetical protein C0623_02220 [Desulfuromonas sp.]|nr:MAG: hypothetical protein C0623_02220 [Desulfuromonas sp.]